MTGRQGLRHALRSTVIIVGLFGVACGSSTPTETSSTIQTESVGASLIGTRWSLVSIDGREPVRTGPSITAAFTENDQVAGSAGCNRYVGRAAAASARLDVGPLATTKMYCDAEGVMTQEQAYLTALEKAKAYRIEGSQLRLGPSAGVVTLVFERFFER